MGEIADKIERLKMFYNAKTDEELAKKLDVSVNTVRSWKQRKAIPAEYELQIMQNAPINASANIVSIKLYKDVRLSAGGGTVNYSADTALVTYDEAYYRNQIYHKKNGVHCAIVDGDSMLPTFQTGDIALVDETDITLKDGKVYVINYFGEDMIKRMRRYGKDVVFIGDNEDIEVFKFRKLEDGVSIIGRVVKNLSVRDL
jgi:phage repressor protein C with HTH and peptisase S24 domain